MTIHLLGHGILGCSPAQAPLIRTGCEEAAWETLACPALNNRGTDIFDWATLRPLSRSRESHKKDELAHLWLLLLKIFSIQMAPLLLYDPSQFPCARSQNDKTEPPIWVSRAVNQCWGSARNGLICSRILHVNEKSFSPTSPFLTFTFPVIIAAHSPMRSHASFGCRVT